MTAPVSNPNIETTAARPLAHEPSASVNGWLVTGWCVLAVLLIVNVPLFVCMPLNNDVVLYDMQARNWLRGGVLYRDILEPNLPGIVWIHIIIRSLFGWSSEAMRMVDLVFFSGTVWLSMRWLKRAGLSPALRVWCANALFLCYFSLIEWNHCQRDIWMLLPALVALHLRRRQTERLQAGTSGILSLIGWSALEGFCWSCAVWIKPHIVIPAGMAWIVSAFFVRRLQPLLIDALSLLATGILAGGAGLWWLHVYEALPWFKDMMFNWNPRYFQAGKEHWERRRMIGTFVRDFPWSVLLPLAVATALATLLVRRSSAEDDSPSSSKPIANQPIVARDMIAAFFLAWLVQAFLLQHQFDYVFTPTLVLAVVVLFSNFPQWLQSPQRSWFIGLAAVFVVVAVLSSPLRKFDRTSCWLQCLAEGSSSAVRDSVRLETLPLFKEQQPVIEFLRSQDVKDREVMIYYDRVIPLYFEMDLRPPTRYVYFLQIMSFFKDLTNSKNDRRRQMYYDLKQSPQRFVVVDLSSAENFSLKEALEPGDETLDGPPPVLDTTAKNLYPWSYPIVFRSGPYLVFKVEGPMGKLQRLPPRKDQKPKPTTIRPQD